MPNQALQPTAGRSDVKLSHGFTIKLRSKARSRRWWLSSFSLDLMHRYPDWLTVTCSLGFLVANIFALALWLYGLIRTRLWFFSILVFAGALGTFLAVVNTIIYYNPPLVIHTLGQARYSLLFYGYIYSLLGQFILSLICLTAVVRWIRKAQERLGAGGV